MAKRIPFLLILFRLLLAPVILTLAFRYGNTASPIILILMYAGLISDIIDGIVARHLGVATTSLRRFDSQADMIFWLSIGFASWKLNPTLISDNAAPIIFLLFLEASCYLVSFAKFGRETCTHAYLSKLWGLSLLAAFTFLIAYHEAETAFTIAIVMGVISHLDRILITLILPRWTHDVPSAYHAFLIRKGIPFKKYKAFN